MPGIASIFTFLAASVGLLAGPWAPAAYAHYPQWVDPGQETVVPTIDVSYAWYGELESGSQIDTYVLEGSAGQHLHAGISVPDISGLEDFQVNLVLFGPGLPPIRGRDLPEGTLLSPNQEYGPVCEGSGYGVAAPPESGEDYFEPFTQTRYLGRQTLEVDLPETGTYYLVVNSAEAVPGKYVLDTGSEESFGFADIVRFPVWWVKAQLYFGHIWRLVAAGAVLSVLLLGAIFIFVKASRRIPPT